MADFEYAFASAGSPVSHTVPGTDFVVIAPTGIGSLKVISPLADGVHILNTGGASDDTICQAMIGYIQRFGYGHDGAGGYVQQATLQRTPSTTAVAAAD